MRCDHGGNGAVAVLEALQDGALAHLAVRAKAAHVGLGIADFAAMGGEVEVLGPGEQPVERGHVVAHRPVGRRDDRRRPPHHMIPGEQDACILQRESEVVGRVPGRRHGLEPIAARLDDSAVGQRSRRARNRRRRRRRGARDRLRAAAAPACAGLRARIGAAGSRLQGARARRMVAVRMGNEDARNPCAADRPQQRFEMGGVRRPGIEDGEVRVADQECVGALEGERPGIARQ